MSTFPTFLAPFIDDRMRPFVTMRNPYRSGTWFWEADEDAPKLLWRIIVDDVYEHANECNRSKALGTTDSFGSGVIQGEARARVRCIHNLIEEFEWVLKAQGRPLPY